MTPPPSTPVALQPLTRADLEAKGGACSCGRPQCPGRAISIVARCHPDAGLRAANRFDSGQLMLTCTVCSAVIMCIQVAWAVPS